MIQIDVQAIHPEFADDLKTQTQDAAGFDMRALFPSRTKDGPGPGTLIDPYDWQLIPLGCKMAIPPEYYIMVAPRSGLALKEGVTLINSPGIIDPDYRGEFAALVHNVSKTPFLVTHGMRICQILVQKRNPAQFNLVEELLTTERGEGGFGSTGTD